MDFIGAALGDGVHHRARGGSEFGRVIARLNVEFAQCVQRRAQHIAGAVIQAAKIVDVPRPIQQKRVLKSGIAIGRKGFVPRSPRRDGSRRQIGQLQIVAPVQRQLNDLPFVHHLGQRAGLILHQRRLSDDGDGGGSGSGLKRHAEVEVIADVYDDAFANHFVEAGGGDDDVVRIRFEQRSAGDALRVRRQRPDHVARLGPGEDHRRVGHHRLGGIGHGDLNLAARSLRLRGS